ncbi:tubulin delta chain-like [Megalops cyprinoides]|uniref:tubulin delta chain-like n=1 Tax=Megalops cyprinoides TaxID=118141 RepID=UPI001863D144|nr:tubulin delta chain-like [Megalops cyprinoides]
MSAVLLQVGQCGNQLGLEWWRLLTETPAQGRELDRYPFSARDGKLGAVFIDSEPKVLRGARQLVRNKRLRESSIVAGQGGRGSNWAYGYHGRQGEGDCGLLQRAMEALRMEAERRDCYCGTILLHSLSGGTGSGLGARLCEEIREEFPAGHILSVSVAPYQSGESPLQHYNTLLSLASLHRSADGLLLFRNDQALGPAEPLQGATGGLSNPSCPGGSFSAMNKHIASCLAGLLLPVHSLTNASGLSLGMEPWELVRSVCPLPAAKLLHTTQACSRDRMHWDSLATSSLQGLPHLSPEGKHHSSRALLAVARGVQVDSFVTSTALQRLIRGHHCVPWNPFPVDHWTDPRDELGCSHSSRRLTVCSNHSSASDLLSRVVRRAGEMIQARAYLHWYQRHGVETQHFQEALDTLNAIIKEYDTQGD